MLDSHSWKWEMSPVKPRKPFSWGSTPIISCRVDWAWVLPSAPLGIHCKLAQEESCVTSLSYSASHQPHAPWEQPRNKSSTLFFFFCHFIPFISLLTISFRLDSQCLWLWVQRRDEVMDWNELDGCGLSDLPGHRRQTVLEALLCGEQQNQTKVNIWSTYSGGGTELSGLHPHCALFLTT